MPRRPSCGAMNATIDEAAGKAGRDPAAIRRLYNVSPGVDADLLAELALEHGMSAFILPCVLDP